MLQRLSLLPGEDGASYEELKTAMIAELDPRTSYLRGLAENIVDLTWEIIRNRRLRDQLILSEFRREAVSELGPASGDFINVLWPTDAAVATVDKLLSPDPGDREAGLAALHDAGLAEGELLARAHSNVIGPVEIVEKRIANLERRRRWLREEFDKLNAGGSDAA